MLTILCFVLLLLFLSGLTSMTEAAFFSVPLSRVHLAVEQKKRWATSLLRIKESLEQPIATIVILNNAINIAGSMLIGQMVATELGTDEDAKLWLGVFSACMTFLVIIFAEIVPKTIGERFSESIALMASTPTLLLTRIFAPILWLIGWITQPFTARKEEVKSTSEEEISVLAKLAGRAGQISSEESELIRRAFRLNDLRAKDIMTHRLELASFSPDRQLGELKLGNLEHEHSRLLVAKDGDLDSVVGVVYLRDILLALARGRKDQTIGSLMHPVTRVFEGTPSHMLLDKFQQTRQHLFVVGDEYGGTSGVVSLEDVLEELVGEIEDEHDAPDSPRSRPANGKRRTPDNTNADLSPSTNEASHQVQPTTADTQAHAKSSASKSP